MKRWKQCLISFANEKRLAGIVNTLEEINKNKNNLVKWNKLIENNSIKYERHAKYLRKQKSSAQIHDAKYLL